jgi:hypothetical protein
MRPHLCHHGGPAKGKYYCDYGALKTLGVRWYIVMCAGLHDQVHDASERSPRILVVAKCRAAQDHHCGAQPGPRTTPSPSLVPLHLFFAQNISRDDVKSRIDTLVEEVNAVTRNKDFSPGKSWWLWNRNGKTDRHPDAVPFEEQLGLTAKQISAGACMGRYWRKNILKLYGGKLQLWPSGMDSMDWVTIVPTRGALVAPDADTIVTSGSDVNSLRKIIVDDAVNDADAAGPSTSRLPQPTQPKQPSEKDMAAASQELQK